MNGVSARDDGFYQTCGCEVSPAAGGTFLSLNKKVPKEVSKGESVVCLAPAMQATLPLNPFPAASP